MITLTAELTLVQLGQLSDLLHVELDRRARVLVDARTALDAVRGRTGEDVDFRFEVYDAATGDRDQLVDLLHDLGL